MHLKADWSRCHFKNNSITWLKFARVLKIGSQTAAVPEIA